MSFPRSNYSCRDLVTTPPESARVNSDSPATRANEVCMIHRLLLLLLLLLSGCHCRRGDHLCSCLGSDATASWFVLGLDYVLHHDERACACVP